MGYLEVWSLIYNYLEFYRYLPIIDVYFLICYYQRRHFVWYKLFLNYFFYGTRYGLPCWMFYMYLKTMLKPLLLGYISHIVIKVF